MPCARPSTPDPASASLRALLYLIRMACGCFRLDKESQRANKPNLINPFLLRLVGMATQCARDPSRPTLGRSSASSCFLSRAKLFPKVSRLETGRDLAEQQPSSPVRPPRALIAASSHSVTSHLAAQLRLFCTFHQRSAFESHNVPGVL